MESNRETAYDARVSAGYAEVDDTVGWVLGYPFALRALGVGGPDAPETLLEAYAKPQLLLARGRCSERRRHAA
jgi:hypothetical protein